MNYMHETTDLGGHSLSRLEAKAKLEQALQEYVQEVSGAEFISRTDYVLCVAAVDLELPANATYYYHETSGPMHSLAGLVFMAGEEIKMLNREEYNYSND